MKLRQKKIIGYEELIIKHRPKLKNEICPVCKKKHNVNDWIYFPSEIICENISENVVLPKQNVKWFNISNSCHYCIDVNICEMGGNNNGRRVYEFCNK